jgi:predicted GIY-YIG superfamily endonuclease
MRSFNSFELVYKEEYPTRKLAMQREWELKQLKKIQKEKLIQEATNCSSRD